MSIALAVVAALLAPVPPAPADFAHRPVTRIAFGSCAKQDKPQPIWDRIVEVRPDLMVMLGDNVYGDTEDMDVLRATYAELGAKPAFRRAAAAFPFLAVWDDHDYGADDSGREYPRKAESKAIMLDFFGEPAGSPRREREGNYDAVVLGPPDRRVQFLLLDLRTFRTPLDRRERTARERDREVGPYVPVADDDATMLGAAQWAWLGRQLREPAQLRVVCLSTQCLPEFNGWEAWANLPRERDRLIALIAAARAEGVLLISGDTHWAELSRIEPTGAYPLVELTSSGLTEVWRRVAPNRNRIVGSHLGANFGTIEIDWDEPDPEIALRILDGDGRTRLAHRLRLSALTFAEAARPRTAAAFAGEWWSDFGPLSIVVDGDRATGRYGDDHRLEGAIVAGELRGRWTHRDGAAAGPVAFRVSRDGRFLQGGWAFDDDRAAADGGLPFSWCAERRDWNAHADAAP